MSVFSSLNNRTKVFTGNHFFIIRDGFPVSPGHLLIISNREVQDYFELKEDEKLELIKMIDRCKTLIESEFNPDGYNLGMNCGKAAGQTVMHFHFHVIPRYNGDMDNPRGGIRHCVDGKGYY
ncbi:HIT family protein [Robiginitalea aurantiaca]|uniref:HIT family protein n=1 Tax=Robiginitalea aurantiaca TaxID=3056915 RepID=A0ABT7WBD3_9FLAO|nr:HIT family protein [Robiginitalea aurantiaca]MDM9630220.1 HIT family protein [Robiginitalea aurantiaca]